MPAARRVHLPVLVLGLSRPRCGRQSRPGLNDNYWTYPKNKTDKGLFETIFGGGQGMMGPHNDLQLNELLLAMAWIRHLYTGPVKGAKWLTEEQKANYTPYKLPEGSDHGTIDQAKAAPDDKCGPMAK